VWRVIFLWRRRPEVIRAATTVPAEGGSDGFISGAEGRRRPGGLSGPNGPVGVGLARLRLGPKQLD
jgi:hypothetical protein